MERSLPPPPYIFYSFPCQRGLGRREVGLGEAFGSRFEEEMSSPGCVFAGRQLLWGDAGRGRRSEPWPYWWGSPEAPVPL